MELTSYLVEVDGRYFVCEDKPEIKAGEFWQTDGMHVEIPHHLALIFSHIQKIKLTKNCIIDLAETEQLF